MLIDLDSDAPASSSFKAEDALSNMAYSYGFGVADFDRSGQPGIAFFESNISPRQEGERTAVNGYIFGRSGLRKIIDHDTFPELVRHDLNLLERLDTLMIDDDDYPDIAGVNNSYGAVVAFVNSGDGSKLWSRNYISSEVPGALNIQAGDVDNDGDADLIVNMRQGSNDDPEADYGVAWLENPGDATFPWKKRIIASGPNRKKSRSLVVGDFNGDDRLDVASTDNSTGALTLALGNCGTDWAVSDFPINANSAFFGRRTDIDGDGRDEILQPTFNDLTIYWVDEQNVLQANQLLSFNTTKSIIVSEVDVADLNNDGRKDIVAAIGSYVTGPETPAGWIYAFIQTDTGFEPLLIEKGRGNYVAVKIIDFDGDDRPDIIGNVEYYTQAITVYRNQLAS